MPNLSLRQKLCFSVAMIGICFVLASCATTWITEADQIIATVVPAVAAILGLIGALSGKVTTGDLTLLTNAANEVTNDLNNVVKPLIDQYSSAVDQAAQQDLLNKIQIALQTVIGNWGGVLDALHIEDPAVQAKIQAVAGLVLTEINALLNLLPVLKTAAASGDTDLGKMLATLRAQGTELPLDAGHFKKAFNSEMKQKTGNSAVDNVTGQFILQ